MIEDVSARRLVKAELGGHWNQKVQEHVRPRHVH
jgi:hypothetical protein